MSSLQNRQGQQPNVGKLGIRWKDHPDRLAIGNLTPNSASAQIGLRPGDEIVSIGGQNVVNEQQFNTAMQREMSRLGNNRTARIPFVIRRNGELQTLYWISDALAIAGYGLFARGYRAGSYAPDGQYIAGYRGYVNRSSAFLGVDLDQRNQNAAAVSRVIPGSPAEQAGLSEGDEIWSVNDRRINSPQELSFVIGQLQPGQTVSLLVGRPTNVQVVLGQRPGSADIRPAVPSQAPIPPQLQGLAPPARQRGGPVPAPAQPAPSDAAPELQNSDTP
ncbi:MAG: PDZ domain-containing protein [Planctomycetia bacterium]|nr:PDZ domain-containing protein [Planctomycetia bacterium]